jgi:hypothetical protein
MMTEEEIVKKLKEHPELKARFEQLISIIENPKDEITLADDAEMRVIGQMRELRREVLQDWANRQSDKVSKRVVEQRPAMRKHVKKNCSGTRHMEK